MTVHLPLRRLALIPLLAALIAPLAACGAKDDPNALVIYNAQHKQLLDELVPIFEKKTGIKVKVRSGDDLEMASQLIAEGSKSPADVFLTENSPAMSAVERAGLLAPLSAEATDPIPAQYRPTSGLWTGFAARSTVLVYNTDKVTASELPASILDLAKPKWKGRISFSPTGADFQAIVAGVLDLEGEAKTKAWHEGLKTNGTVYDGNNVVLQSVNAGKSDIGIIYHYYWYRDQAEDGEVSNHSALYFFGHQDPGAFLSVSGAGVLKTSKHAKEADEFVSFLTSTEGQQALAKSYALEYPLNPAASLPAPVKPFSELQPPAINVTELDSDKVIKLLTDVGFL